MVNNPIVYNMEMSVEQEIALVKKGLRMQAADATKWHPIVMDWFNRWKAYVNFDRNVPEPRDPEEIKGLHPGRIDNTKLGNSPAHFEELRRGLMEGEDMVLLPFDIASVLFKKYGGEMNFSRGTVNIGASYAPVMQINLYPIRVEVYHCHLKNPKPNSVNSPGSVNFVKTYFTKSKTFGQIAKELRDKFNVYDSMDKTRYWMRDPEEKVSLSNNSASYVDFLSTGSNKRARTGRMLFGSLVNWDEDWKLLGDAKELQNVTLLELLGNKDGIEMIIETMRSSYISSAKWPRDELLQNWKHNLQKGDIMDVLDRHRKWYEGTVKEVDEQKNVHIHFLCWEESFDELICAEDVERRLKPLHSETSPRSMWEVGDKIDVKSNGKWIIASIVDTTKDQVKIKFTLKTQTNSLINSAHMDVDDAEDDNVKKKKNDDAYFFDDEEIGSNDLVDWYDLYSEAICALHTHTHTEKPAVSLYSSPFTSTLTSALSTGGRYGAGAYSYEVHSKGKPVVKGAVGLQNLGNTCFMNSILQCLSHTMVLTKIFVNDSYLKEINYNNVLGHNGKVAQVYGKLVKDIWSDMYNKVVPREFKSTIGEFQPQFAGYDQQDAQEFMGFLLDGLHEDLNRIEKKPAVSKIESKGRSDHIIAAESWRRYLLRNSSVIVDHFFGLLKSHVTCTNCGAESVTFDAYSSLSLPIPIKNTKPVFVLVQLLDKKKEIKWVKVCLDLDVTEVMTSLQSLLVDKLESLGLTENMLTNGSEGFEMVDNKIEKEDDYTVISNPTIRNSNKEKYNFHFALAYPSRLTSMYKNYNSKEAGNVSIVSFCNKQDVFVAFQLEHYVKDFKPFYSSHISYGGYGGIKETTPETPNLYFGVDVCYAQKTMYDRVELMGVMHRMTFPKEGMTNIQLRKRLIDVFIRPLCQEADYEGEDNSLFSLIVMNSYATQIIREIENNDDSMEEIVEGKEILVIMLKPALLTPATMNYMKSNCNTTDYSAPTESFSVGSTNDITIYDCLNKFIEREALASSETIYCGKCKQHLPPIKKMDIYSTPDILILHLKRFQFIPGQYFVHREKINQNVIFPVKGLDLRKYIIGKDFLQPTEDFVEVDAALEEGEVSENAEDCKFIYDLYAVSHHMGGLGGGHYTASCEGGLSEKWFYFNDSSVSETEAGSAVSGTAYVLFYKRRKSMMKWGGLQPSAVPMPDEE